MTKEHQETNFDHYIKNYLLIVPDNEVTFKLEEGWKENFCHSWSDNFREWLLLPYEEPKPKYKLSMFEYVLLDYCCYKQYDAMLKDWTVLMDMRKKGHYKDIPNDISIREILANCEVINS